MFQMIAKTLSPSTPAGVSPWYVKVVKELRVGWTHETFGGRNVVERFFLYTLNYDIKRFSHTPKSAR